ncbi:serpentine receptor-like protein, class xa domain-containing protein [Ditylenchus destructor]|nr:serpentine receptor-like protein, class xa domain-containing protein [Ditylenchus destructor]
MATISTLANSFLILAFVQGKKQFKTSSFFIIAWQLLFCDLMGLFLQFVLIIPETFAGYWIYSRAVVLSFGSLDSFSYIASLCFALLLTINRFCIFILPRVDRFLFQRPRLFVLIAMIWMLVLFHVIGSYCTGYYIDFSIQEYHLLQVNPEGNPFRKFANAYAYWTPIVMLVIYIVIFARLKAVRGTFRTNCFSKGVVAPTQNNVQLGRNVLTSRHEILFLLQSSLICIIFLLEHMAFAVLPHIAFLDNGVKILLLTAHAVIIFSFNSKVRSELDAFPCLRSLTKSQSSCRRRTNTTITVATTAMRMGRSVSMSPSHVSQF